MQTDLFEEYIEKAIESLPVEFRLKLNNVAVVVEDEPTFFQRSKLRLRKNMLLLGLYEGVPQTRRGGGYGVGGTLPDKITLFRKDIAQVARTEEAVVRQVRNTLLHEIGHHFGMSEKQIRKAQDID